MLYSLTSCSWKQQRMYYGFIGGRSSKTLHAAEIKREAEGKDKTFKNAFEREKNERTFNLPRVDGQSCVSELHHFLLILTHEELKSPKSYELTHFASDKWRTFNRFVCHICCISRLIMISKTYDGSISNDKLILSNYSF